MKSIIRTTARVLTILATVFGPVSIVRGQYVYMTLDEYGAGAPRIDASSAQPAFIPPLPFPVGYTITNDPLSGISTLRYTLRQSGQTPGDLYLTDPSTSLISDIIRFDGQGHVFFFSLKEPGQTSFSLADVDALPTLEANSLGQVELPEQNQTGNLFNPIGSQPGFDPLYGGALGYNIISEVSEPSALVAGSLGMMMMLAARGSRRGRS
jgi:hypothetical protein